MDYNTECLRDAIIEACRDENLYYHEINATETRRALHIQVMDDDDWWVWCVTLTRVPGQYATIDPCREIYIAIGEPFDTIDYDAQYRDMGFESDDIEADIVPCEADREIEIELSAAHVNNNVTSWVAKAVVEIQSERLDKAQREECNE